MTSKDKKPKNQKDKKKKGANPGVIFVYFSVVI